MSTTGSNPFTSTSQKPIRAKPIKTVFSFTFLKTTQNIYFDSKTKSYCFSTSGVDEFYVERPIHRDFAQLFFESCVITIFFRRHQTFYSVLENFCAERKMNEIFCFIIEQI